MRATALAVLLLCVVPTVVLADPTDDYIQQQMHSRHIPGVAAAVIRNGQVVKVGTYGLANIEWKQPVTPNAPFWLDSLTKLFTAVGVMQLVERGQLSLDDSITMYLTDAPPEWKAVTVRHLLAHQSGIKDDYWEQYKGSPLVHYDDKDIYNYALKQPLQFTPGDRSEYDNAGYYLLGVIISRVTHMPYTKWITKNVLEPAGTKTATMYDPWAIIPQMVSSYTLKKGRVAHNRADILSDRGEAIAGWGLYASLDDLIAFDAALRSGRLISRQSLDVMWSNARLNSGAPGRSGLGFANVLFYRGHRYAGKGGQAGVVYVHFPEDDLSIILLTNLENVGAYGMIPSIAAFYIPSLHPLSSLSPQPDSDPRRAEQLRQAMNDIAGGKSPVPLLTAAMNATVTPEFRDQTRKLLSAMSSFQFLACDKPSPKDPYGVARYCYYRATVGPTVLNLIFGLTKTGQIATAGGEPR